MVQLFKQETPKAQRVMRVENLNAEKGYSASLRVSKDQKDYTVVLCLPTHTVKTVFHNEYLALEELSRIRKLYKAKKVKKQ